MKGRKNIKTLKSKIFKKFKRNNFGLLGFTLIEVLVGVVVFAIFAFGVYEGVRVIYKVVYLSRLRVVETALLAEFVETLRNMPYEKIGILGGIPAGEIPYERIIERDRVAYRLLTTVRNIDDPFDGTIDTIPQDTAPADYKLVEMSIICVNCHQKKPLVMNTIIAPNGLENSSYNGALFIKVFDASGLPVVNAMVTVVNNEVVPPINMVDYTDNQGFLRIVDTPTGTQSYQIMITKEGYSSDYTVSTTIDRTKPKKPHVTVAERTTTESFFSIDLLSNLNIKTISPTCAVIAGRGFNIWSNKLIGEDPPEYKFTGNYITDSIGIFLLNNIEWDAYYFNTTNTAYDLAGTIPMLPLSLIPGSTQEISLILRPKSTNSLLVNVLDQATGLPLSGVNIRLYSATTSYDQTITTGLGYSRQTDWSGGGGQEFFEDESRYYGSDGNIDIDNPSGDLKLRFYNPGFALSGLLESSTFDIGTEVNFQNIFWEPLSQSELCGANPVKLQIATSNSSSPASWDFYGPDGTVGSYYTATSSMIHTVHNGNRYLRYKVYLETEDSDCSPLISDISFTYTNSCIPPGQSFFAGLNSGQYLYELSKSGYQTVIDYVDVSGYTTAYIMLANE